MRKALERLTALIVIAGFCMLAAQAVPSRELEPAGVADGAGIWANIWNYPTGDLDAYCKNLRAHGIRNVFIQTSRSNTDAIKHPQELGQLIEACHRHHIRVIGWAFAELINPRADADKMIAAARFRSPTGEQLDAIAPDLEKNLSAARVEAYSKRIREALGWQYPMMAVVYSPLNHAAEVARIPWKVIAQYYNIIAPMSYWNSKYEKLEAYDYTLKTCRKIRELTGKPDVEIHVIGDGMGTRHEEILAFMKGCKSAEATSASLYPNHQMTDEQFISLSRYQDYFQPNSRFRLAAFRQMLKTGAVDGPARHDPAQPITRGEFYKLLVKHMRLNKPAMPHHAQPADVDQETALTLMSKAGLIALPQGTDTSQLLASPLYGDEAFSLLAQIVDVQPLHHKAHGKGKRRPDRWFAPPAQAATRHESERNAQPINYLDASLMVLEASSSR